MNRIQLIGGGLALLVAVAVLGGCGPDPKERIKMLEGSNQSLQDQLTGCQNELDQLRAERDNCVKDLAAARMDASALKDQLAAQPKVPEGWTAVPGGAMIAIEGWALFDEGLATIQTGSSKVLDLVAATVQKDYPTKDVLVFGHTDDQPIKATKDKWKDNWELSAQRALTVVRYFGSKGIDMKRLVACGCGEFRPRVKNDSEQNRQKNRRVEIYVLDPQPRTGKP